MLLGAHVPVSGGLAKGPHNGRAIGASAIQVFTRNQVRWGARPLDGEEVHAFRAALLGSGVEVVLAHASYLINLASPDPELLAKSRDAFVAELRRCEALGIRYLVFHPGAHLGAGDAAGLRTVAESLDAALASVPAPSVRVLLEITAGQGTCLGHRFEHLAEVLGRVAESERLGVCLDTCHLLAAGYDIASERGYASTFAEFERVVGLARLEAFHLNDAKQGLGSRVDRHERIGKGHLGTALFRRLLSDPRFASLPAVLETPGPLAAWKRELKLLQRLARPRG